MNGYDKIWQRVLGELELLVGRINFTTWFKSTFIIDIKDNDVFIAVPNIFTRTWIQSKHTKEIITILEKSLSKSNLQLIYKIKERRNNANISKKNNINGLKKVQPVDKIRSIIKSPVNKFGLDLKYTFNNFVVGPGNELAQAAAQAAAKKPGEMYNPLFIYGGVGLGKTHLIQAVGNYILSQNPSKKLLYINSEKFTNDFIYAIKGGKTDTFKNNYRSVDVLLIDDIQFIAGKEQTQEEFFHTFNALHQNHKQIVISSDRPPKAIPSIEKRLVSRFEWGMIADVSSPDLETRVAILEMKCQEKNYNIEKDIINYIAENIQENIRELEGALNRITAFHELNNTSPTIESVKSILGGVTANIKKAGLTSKKLLNNIALFYDVKMEDLLGSSRKNEIVVPRQIAMFLMRQELNSSYPNIGQNVGGRDHTTAMHACEKINKLIDQNEKIKNDISILKQKIYE